MRIITINLPESYITRMDGLTGENGLYPSRSELVRVAVRDYLLNRLKHAEGFEKLAPVAEPKVIVTKKPKSQNQTESKITTENSKIPKLDEVKVDFDEFIQFEDDNGAIKTFKIIKKQQ